jgi:hypothetical protein
MRTWPGLLLLGGITLLSAVSLAEPPRGLRLELRPQLDEVFADAAEYQRTLDRFQERAQAMRRVSDEFARAVQETLTQANLLSQRSAARCPANVMASYGRAYGLGQEYLRIGRDLSRLHDQVRELDRLGDSVGLTPDYRARVKQVLRGYEALLADYREMKATFHDQLTDELRFAGCDPAGARDTVAAQPEVREPVARPVKEPATVRLEPASILFYVDNSRCRRGHQVYLDGQPLGEVAGSARGAFRATAGPHELCLLGQSEPPGTRVASAAQVPGRPCDPGTVRRSYLHEGWTIALRCE